MQVELASEVCSLKSLEEERVIAYFSRTFECTRMSLLCHRRELLAVVKAIKHFHAYLYGRKFIIRTDHSASLAAEFLSPRGPDCQVD